MTFLPPSNDICLVAKLLVREQQFDFPTTILYYFIVLVRRLLPARNISSFDVTTRKLSDDSHLRLLVRRRDIILVR